MAAGSDPLVERVREANDIVEVIGEVVALRKSGSRLGGLCPFHREKSPSFTVNPSMQVYHCFGCGAGGDIFRFVMEHEKMSFPEALRHLAARAGIELPDQRGPATDQLERIREALRVARAYFRAQLEGAEGEEGRAYLDRRGIRPEVRERYGLGMAPDRWDGLLRHARPLLAERSLIEAGLAAESEGGRIYDRFRHRLMIPIETGAGGPVGFGGRLLGDGEPKYVNSPETALYRKGAILFGTAPAREGIRAEGRVVLVEGYFDVIALVQGGIPGVVGTCGTALTGDQATLLKRLSDRLVLLFDGDDAGLRATLRALPLLVGVVPEVRVARPPDGKDPDDWIRSAGTEVVAAALAAAPGPLAFLESLTDGGVITRREGARRAAELAAVIHDPLDRDLWTQEGATRFGIHLEAFTEGVRRLATGRSGRAGLPSEQGDRRFPIGARSSGSGASAGPGAADAPWSAVEREAVRRALLEPAAAAELDRAMEEAFGFVTPAGEVVRWIAGAVAGSDRPARAAELVSRAVHEIPAGPAVAALVARASTPAEPLEVLVADLRRRELKRRMDELGRRIRAAEEGGDRGLLDGLLAETQALAAERARLLAAADHPPPGPAPAPASAREAAETSSERPGRSARSAPAPEVPDPFGPIDAGPETEDGGEWAAWEAPPPEADEF